MAAPAGGIPRAASSWQGEKRTARASWPGMAASKIIPDRGVVLAWSPLAGAGGVLATGVKEGGGGGFEEYGGDLTLHSVDLGSPSQHCPTLGRCVCLCVCAVCARAPPAWLLCAAQLPSSHTLALSRPTAPPCVPAQR